MQVMKMLHRKIHPENNVADKEFVKSYKEKKIISYDGGYGGGSIEQLEKNDKSFQGSKPKEWTEYCKNNRNLQQNEYSCSISGGNKEHWIKTDADCKYSANICSVFTDQIILSQTTRIEPEMTGYIDSNLEYGVNSPIN